MTEVKLNDKYTLPPEGSGAEYDKKYYDAILKYLTEQGFPFPGGGYVLGVPDCDDRVCLHRDGQFWVVYYSERGKRINPAFFTGNMAAGDFIVMSILSHHEACSSIKGWRNYYLRQK